MQSGASRACRASRWTGAAALWTTPSRRGRRRRCCRTTPPCATGWCPPPPAGGARWRRRAARPRPARCCRMPPNQARTRPRRMAGRIRSSRVCGATARVTAAVCGLATAARRRRAVACVALVVQALGGRAAPQNLHRRRIALLGWARVRRLPRRRRSGRQAVLAIPRPQRRCCRDPLQGSSSRLRRRSLVRHMRRRGNSLSSLRSCRRRRRQKPRRRRSMTLRIRRQVPLRALLQHRQARLRNSRRRTRRAGAPSRWLPIGVSRAVRAGRRGRRGARRQAGAPRTAPRGGRAARPSGASCRSGRRLPRRPPGRCTRPPMNFGTQ